MNQPLGVILAGGLATRMGGGDKGLLQLRGTPILQRVIDRLGPQTDGLILNANGDATRFADYDLQVVSDSISGFAGPLAGVLAGLDAACDLVPQLLAAGGDQGLALAASPSGRQPTFGLWPVVLRDELRTALQDGLRKVVMWTQKHNAGTAAFPDDAAFFNVNTPEDLKTAERMA